MTLESLSLKNFKRYASKEIAFESGLYGILGRNGSGKSTIFEAVFFALYGDNKASKELIPTAGSEGGVKVELQFSINEKTYIVTREFRGKSLVAHASLKHNDESIASGAKEVTIAITKLLGMAKDAFLHTVFASQKELTTLSSMKNEDRKAMMRKLLGLEKIDKIEDMIRDELRDLNRDLRSASTLLLDEESLNKLNDALKEKTELAKVQQAKIKLFEQEIAKLKASYETAKTAVDAQQKAKEARQKKLEQLEIIKQAQMMHEKQLSELSIELKQLLEKQTHYNKELPLKTKLATIEKQLAEQDILRTKHLKKDGLEKEQTQLRAEFTARKDEVANLTKEIAPLEELQKQLLLSKTKLTEQKTTNDKLTEEINKLNAEVATNKSKIADVQNKINSITKLGKDSSCPTCTRPLLEEYDSVLKSLQSEIATVYQKQIDEVTIKLNTLNEQKANLQKELSSTELAHSTTDKQVEILISKSKDLVKAQNTFKEVKTRGLSNKAALAELGVVVYDEALHKNIKSEYDALKPQVEALVKMEALIATIPEKTNTIQKLESQITLDKTTIEAQQKIIAEDSYNEKAHTEVVENAKKAETAKDGAIAESQKLALEHTNIKRDIEAIEKELKRDSDQKEALKSKENDKNDYEKLKVYMSDFKTHINARVAPRIGEVASEMYSRITRGKYQHIEVSSEFDFCIYDGGERYPIERFSGGEIDLANLVLRIAISKTLGELSGGGNIGFLAFDEVFGSQDEERRFRIMEAFHTISESYRQIFLISHETEIKEMFERVIEL
jgi:exonuclease SbcC